ncbi:MAG: hypothetical protein KC800_29055, partial [Candidatus Eremiobacteraeota bacterium]|nr:hypothetical protein [Candidatus Eremiobacteraeota bacterium]
MSRQILLIFLSCVLLAQAALAESAAYHLKRLDIQARAFLAQLDGPAVEVQTEDVSVDKQLESTVNNQSSWAEDMVREDLLSVVSTVPSLLESIKSGNTDEYSKARVELESLARRLRISTSPLQLDPQEQASLELLMLELDEAASVVSEEREQLAAQRDSRRSRQTRVSVGVGYGYGSPWGGWNSWGYPG